MEWLLSSDNFSFWDRLKIAGFVLGGGKLTMGEKVEEFENEMEFYADAPCVATSSGSSANSLVFELYKYQNPTKFKNSIVIVPAVTWISSITPATMSGYNIEFCDINLTDFCFDYDKLEKIVEKNRNLGKNVIIWSTALIGFCPDFNILNKITAKYGAELWLDSCENLMSKYQGKSILSSCDFVTTSCYFSHQITSVEFGFVFNKSGSQIDFLKMFRNHGLTRSLPPDNIIRTLYEKYNQDIDPEFLFAVPGSNYRATDMHAVWGLQDFRRIKKYEQHRVEIYNYYHDNLNHEKYYLPDKSDSHVAFCLPIFCRGDHMQLLKQQLNICGIQTRPIIGSNLLLQPVFFKYWNESNKNDFPNAQWVHEHGFYVGLNYKTNKRNIDFLVKSLG